MKPVTNPFGKHHLLVWRTETLFNAPERRTLAGEWSHVRFTALPFPDEPKLVNLDLPATLPFADATFDAIYSFHVAEHLHLDDNARLMRELRRVLKPGGILRISTPDLAYVAEDYVRQLHEQLAAPAKDTFARYHWAACNLIDQCVRRVPGGMMLDAAQRGLFEPDHVKYHNGDSLDPLFHPEKLPPAPRSRREARLVDGTVTRDWGFLLRRAWCSRRRRRITSGSPERRLAAEREKNCWLFDRVSLPRLFAEAGFREIEVADYKTSRIEQWSRYDFDRSVYGDYPLEPSLYVEGRR